MFICLLGIEILMKTNEDVNKLQISLKDKKKEFEIKKLQTEELLNEITKQRIEVESQQILADLEILKANEINNNTKLIENEALINFELAKPAMNAAKESVNCLDKSSMTELKSFSKPPPGVEKVTSALLIMIKLEKRDFR